MTDNILYSVGKRVRTSYLRGEMDESEVMIVYNRYLKDADKVSFNGWAVHELRDELKKTSNPILRQRIQNQIEEHKTKHRVSIDQNKLSLEKLAFFRNNALGIGLRKVLKEMKTIANSSNLLEDKITLLLLELEFANLSAKRYSHKKELIYERKSSLLMRLSELIQDTGWRCGISYKTGKNASYIIYVYLPNDVQLSWHCNDYEMVYLFDEINCTWDGQVCMTMEKILNYIHLKYNIGNINNFINN